MSPLILLILALGLILAVLPNSILAASNIIYAGHSKLPLDPCDKDTGPWDNPYSAAISQNISNYQDYCGKCIQLWYYDKTVTVPVRSQLRSHHPRRLTWMV